MVAHGQELEPDVSVHGYLITLEPLRLCSGPHSGGRSGCNWASIYPYSFGHHLLATKPRWEEVDGGSLRGTRGHSCYSCDRWDNPLKGISRHWRILGAVTSVHFPGRSSRPCPRPSQTLCRV